MTTSQTLKYISGLNRYLLHQFSNELHDLLYKGNYSPKYVPLEIEIKVFFSKNYKFIQNHVWFIEIHWFHCRCAVRWFVSNHSLIWDKSHREYKNSIFVQREFILVYCTKRFDAWQQISGTHYMIDNTALSFMRSFLKILLFFIFPKF